MWTVTGELGWTKRGQAGAWSLQPSIQLGLWTLCDTSSGVPVCTFKFWGRWYSHKGIAAKYCYNNNQNNAAPKPLYDKHVQYSLIARSLIGFGLRAQLFQFSQELVTFLLNFPLLNILQIYINFGVFMRAFWGISDGWFMKKNNLLFPSSSGQHMSGIWWVMAWLGFRFVGISEK